jgi:hypothetical protein
MANSTDKTEQACQQQQQEQKQKQMQQPSPDFHLVRKTIQIPRKSHKGKTQPGDASLRPLPYFLLHVPILTVASVQHQLRDVQNLCGSLYQLTHVASLFDTCM